MTHRFGKADFGKTARVRAGDHLWIDLVENGTTGFFWEVDGVDEAGLALVDSTFTPPDTGAAGAAGRRLFEFAARGTGVRHLTFRLTCPWRPKDPPAETGRITFDIGE